MNTELLTKEEELALLSEFADQVMMEEFGVDCDEDDCAFTRLGYCPCQKELEDGTAEYEYYALMNE